MKSKIVNFIDHISVARKIAILIAVITTGVLFLGAFSHLGLYHLKNDFDTFYDKQYQMQIKLHKLHALFNSNALSPNAKQEWQQFKKQYYKIQNISKKETIYYTRLIRSTDRTVKNIIDLNNKKSKDLKELSLKLNNKFLKISNFLAKVSKHNKTNIDNQYFYTVISLAIMTIFLIVFSILFTTSVVKNTKKLIQSLTQIVKDKIEDYEKLANNYEDKVTKEVIRNREKDQIMYQHARLAAMGEMIGNIAHQWRQPLNALTILIQSFGTKSIAGKLDQKFIDKQVSEGLRLAQQMSNTIEDFRNFFSPHRDQEYFSLVKSLKDTLELVEFFCKDEHIDIKIIAKEDLRIFGYSNEFAQVILNLINNARDNFKHVNMSEERKIIIKVEKKIKAKPYAVISFTDNGGGVDPKIKDRIFEPYFTTKHKSTGTGIGLYMSKQIIEKQMNGLVTMKNIESKLGGNKIYKCAQFIIAIPIK